VRPLAVSCVGGDVEADSVAQPGELSVLERAATLNTEPQGLNFALLSGSFSG
jgi:hypothetical protein